MEITKTTELRIRSEYACHGGKMGFYTFYSEALAEETSFGVFLPQEALHGEKRPALYVLAGLTCTEETFVTKSGVLAYAAEKGIVVVAPDTSPRHASLAGDTDSYDFGVGAGFYLDATQAPWAAHYRMGQYITEELPHFVEHGFPVIQGHKSIMGHSMGGHGALVHGLRSPASWASVSAFAPICHPSVSPWGIKAFTGYLGKDQRQWAAYDATELLLAGHTCRAPVLIDQGEEDKFLIEGQLLPQDLLKAAEKSGQSLNLRFQPGYDHSYWFIQSFIADHIAHHTQYLL